MEGLEGPNQNLMEAYTFLNSFLIPSSQKFQVVTFGHHLPTKYMPLAGTKNILLPCSDSDCGEVFWSKWSLQKHVKQRHVEKTFPCSFCGKTFIYEANRKDHVKDSHKPKAKLAKGKSKSNVNVKSKSAPKPKQIKRKEGLQSQSTHRGAK